MNVFCKQLQNVGTLGVRRLLGSCLYFSSNILNAVLWTKRILAILSVFACIAVIFLIVILKKYKIFSQRLSLYLAISCLLQSISQIANQNHASGPTCTFLGWLLQFSDSSVLIWICAITFTILIFVIREDQERFTKEWIYHLFGWGLPFLVSLLPFISSKYGPAGMWCWIVNDWRWRMGMYYIPTYILTFIMFIIYGFTQYKTFQLHKQWYGLHASNVHNLERKQKLLKDEVKPVFIYPGVYILLEIIPLGHRIYNAVHPQMEPFPLVLIHSICLSLRGLVNGIVFFTVNRASLGSLKPAQIYVAWLNWKQKDDGLIQEYNTTSSQQYVHNIIVPSAQDQEVQHNEAPTPQSIELDELDRQFYEMTKNIQEFGSELKSVNPKLVESSTPS